jgi:hypothetical protein
VRHGTREHVQFLSHGNGSLALDTQLLLSVDLGYVKPLDPVTAATDIEEIQKMIAAIQRKPVERM